MTRFEGFYQLGFVARDLDRAMAMLSMRYGVTRFREKRADPQMETAHAYAGAMMLEIIAIPQDGLELYRGYIPDKAEAIRLHHHGFRVAEPDRWEEIAAAIEASGQATAMKGAVMDGHLRYLYADTRADLGIYSEYVCLTGPALGIYDDVPHN